MLLIIGKVHLCVFSVLLLEIFFLQNSFSSDLCVCVTKCTKMEQKWEKMPKNWAKAAAEYKYRKRFRAGGVKKKRDLNIAL